jgi:rSAM/selenodomain-associated transferase 1
MRPAQLLVLAKAPVPGRVKTRLCPPCTPEQAARVAAAALADTLAAGGALAVARRTLVLDGGYRPPRGWLVVPQRGEGLGARLSHAFADTAVRGTASLLVGMDTPQVTVTMLDAAVAELSAGGVDAVLGPAHDGGWWALGLRRPHHAAVLRDVPMSRPDTGAATLAALRGLRLQVRHLPALSDVDTAADARAVAALCPPGSRFAVAVRHDVPQPAGLGR